MPIFKVFREVFGWVMWLLPAVCGRQRPVNAVRSGKVIPVPKILELLERRFGDKICATCGIEPAALTLEESQYLVGFRTVDEL